MIRLVLAALTLVALSLPAEARRYHHHKHHHARHHGLPWCGIYLGKYLGKPERRLWVAREWAREGVNAGGPGVDVVVVWRHHVGIIKGRAANGKWIVHSGNDGGAVRERERSTRGIIAYRRPA